MTDPSASRPGRLTVLQVLPALHGSGGVERGTLEIARALVRAGHRALVASAGGDLAQALKAAGAEPVILPLDRRTPWAILANSARLLDLIRAERVDLVHARSRAPAWSAWRACRQGGVPFVTTFHGAYGEDFPGKRQYNSVMASGDRVIAVSRFIRDHIVARYPQAEPRLRLIYRGVDYTAYQPDMIGEDRRAALRQAWHLPAGRPVIMGVGRLSRTKGHDLLLRALARLGGTDWICVLVGGDQGRTSVSNDLRALARAGGFADRVIFAGNCADMPAAYQLADVVVAPSRVPEAFGRMPVEAQAMQRLIITTAIGATVETVEHDRTGWLVAPEDPAAIEQALRSFFALSAEDRRSRELAASALVRQRFDTATMCAQTLEVYGELVSVS